MSASVAADATAPSALSVRTPSPVGLLVVDREEEGILFAKMLRRAGHRVEVVASHARAERRLASGDVDYVLLDVDFLGDRDLSFAWARAHAGKAAVIFMSSLLAEEIRFPRGAERWAFVQKNAALLGGVGGFVAAVDGARRAASGAVAA